jgi:hypothetical protein
MILFSSTISSNCQLYFLIWCVDTTLHRGIQWHTIIIKSKCSSKWKTHTKPLLLHAILILIIINSDPQFICIQSSSNLSLLPTIKPNTKPLRFHSILILLFVNPCLQCLLHASSSTSSCESYSSLPPLH